MPGPSDPSIFHDGTVSVRLNVRGLSTGPGRLVLAGGIVLLAVSLGLILRPGLRRLGWLTALPGLIVAGAVGYWDHRHVPVAPFDRGVSLVPLLGVAATTVAVALWPARRRGRDRLAGLCLAVIVATLVCGVAMVATPQGSGFPPFFGR